MLFRSTGETFRQMRRQARERFPDRDITARLAIRGQMLESDLKLVRWADDVSRPTVVSSRQGREK